MDEALKGVQMAGYPKMESSQGVIDQTKAYYLGSKAASFVFTCFRCQKTYQSKSEFKLTDNYLEQQAKWKASGFIQDFLYNILGSIPVIGYRLTQAATHAEFAKFVRRCNTTLCKIRIKIPAGFHEPCSYRLYQRAN